MNIFEKYISEEENNYIKSGKEQLPEQKLLRAIKEIPFDKISIQDLKIENWDKDYIANIALQILKATIEADGTGFNLIGKHNEKSPVDFEASQVTKGIEVEYEHIPNFLPQDIADNLALAIVKDHLFEIPNYYDKLIKVESEE